MVWKKWLIKCFRDRMFMESGAFGVSDLCGALALAAGLPRGFSCSRQRLCWSSRYSHTLQV